MENYPKVDIPQEELDALKKEEMPGVLDNGSKEEEDVAVAAVANSPFAEKGYMPDDGIEGGRGMHEVQVGDAPGVELDEYQETFVEEMKKALAEGRVTVEEVNKAVQEYVAQGRGAEVTPETLPPAAE